jgi:hypothetical protein
VVVTGNFLVKLTMLKRKGGAKGVGFRDFRCVDRFLSLALFSPFPLREDDKVETIRLK